MSVNLFAGIRRLHLLYNTRYDPIREDDVRDDLLGIKVWISTTAGFDFTLVQPLEFGVGSSVSIDDLEVNTQYFVRYAFISKIDPNTFTVSGQLTATTYDEATRVYGELTNDPIYLSRQLNSTEIDWEPVNGVFRVVDLNTEVTGANDPVKGPVYSTVPNSNTNGLQAEIDPVTGEYYATNWSGISRTGKVTFKAVYDGIEVLRDWNLVDGIGQDAAQLTLTLAPDNFIYQDVTATVSNIPQVTAVASLTNITGTPQFTVTGYSVDGTLLGSIPFTQINNAITVTNQQFHISNNISYAVVRAQLGTVFDEDTIKRLNNGTDAITVDLGNPVVQLQADELGLVDSAEYAESGTEIEVYEGATKLPVSTTLAGAPSWRIINVVGTGITPDPTELISQFSVLYDRHDEMLADTASIEYTIQYKTKAGFVGTRVVKQSFAKSKQGVTGASAPLVTLVSERLAFVMLANSSTITPDFIDIVAQISNIVGPQYLWRENGTVVSGQTGTTLRVNKFSNVNSKTFTVEVSGLSLTGEPISRTTSYTLYFIQEGSDAISSTAVPQQNTVSCDSNGIPDPTQFPLIIDTIAVRGATVLPNSSNSYAIQDVDGLTVSAVPGQPGKFQVTAVSEFYASFTIAMTAGGVTFYHPVYVTKVVDGNSAPVINLTTGNQIFVKRKDGSYSMSQTTITATSQNVTGSFAWYVDNVFQVGQTASTFVVPQFAATGVKVVRCERGSVFDVISIYSIEEGSDAVIVGLTNESQSLAYDELGNLHPGQDINSQMIAIRGSAVLSHPAVSYSLVSTTNGLVAAIGSTTGLITVTEPPTAGSNKQFLAVFRATIASTGATFDKTLSINVTKDGIAGRRTAELKVFQWASTAPAAPSGTSTYTWSTSGYTLPSSAGNWGLVPLTSVPGQKLYQATIRYSDTLTTATSVVSWTGAAVSEAGAAGTNGLPGPPGPQGDSITGPAGALGITARIAYQLVAQNLATPTYSPSTSGGTTFPGANWSGTPPAATVGTIVWYSYGRFNPNFSQELNGIAANTTVWSAPIAASVFQDIKSDNWIGTTPSTTADFSSGYYLRKDNGSIWANNVFMRGNVLALGATTGITGTVFIGDTAYSVSPAMGAAGQGENADTAGKLRAGLYGFANSCSNSAFNVGVLGSGQDFNKGIGVAGSGTLVGVYAFSTVAANPALQARGTNGTGLAGKFEGSVTISSFLTVTGNITSNSNITATGNINATGNITAVGNVVAFNSSDQTLKTNIQRITRPLEKLRNLGGYSYDWIPDYLAKYTSEIELGLVKPHDVGVIAQEVISQVPEAVVTRPDGTLAVAYEKLIPLLIEAILELDRRNQ